MLAVLVPVCVFSIAFFVVFLIRRNRQVRRISLPALVFTSAQEAERRRMQLQQMDTSDAFTGAGVRAHSEQYASSDPPVVIAQPLFERMPRTPSRSHFASPVPDQLDETVASEHDAPLVTSAEARRSVRSVPLGRARASSWQALHSEAAERGVAAENAFAVRFDEEPGETELEVIEQRKSGVADGLFAGSAKGRDVSSSAAKERSGSTMDVDAML